MISLIAWQKIAWLNFHKIQKFISIQTCDRPNFKKQDRKHTFMMSTQKGVGRRFLKFVTCLRIPLFWTIGLLFISTNGGSGWVICWPFLWMSYITFNKAAVQDNNITGKTGSAKLLSYLNTHLFVTIGSIQGIWEVGVRGRGIHNHPPLVSQLQEMG